MIPFLEQVKDQINLRWAWEKVKNAALYSDIWVNEIEFAGFELMLEKNLKDIADEISKGQYRLTQLRPLPFPKNPDKEGKPRVRQCFDIAIRDQVAWTALVNIAGPYVDRKMPVWSYGNRLYRSIWAEKDKHGKKKRNIGHYRHASGRYYLRFGQSWPIFRRHIYLSTRAMSNQKKLTNENERDQEEQEFQESLSMDYRCPFLFRDYWETSRPPGKIKELFWCSLDFKKFYPSIKLDIVLDNIIHYLPDEWKKEATKLLKSMLKFRLNLDEWKNEELLVMGIKPGAKSFNPFNHIPTGLYVAGFLANAGLMKIDLQVSKELQTKKIAHFRYVDDHIILAYHFDDLLKWVDKYCSLIKEAKIGVNINYDKVEPKDFSTYLAARQKNLKTEQTIRQKAIGKCRLDPEFPSPLMTKTIALVSGIARTDFNLLEKSELSSLTEQLEHLLLVDLPEEEIPEKTRLTFAAGRLSKIAECRLANPVECVGEKCRRDEIELDIKEQTQNGKAEELTELKNKLADINNLLKKKEEDMLQEVQRAFQLLRKVLRDRPDRTRLWTRAVIMCRLTGVKGLGNLFDDIKKTKGNNEAARLTFETLLAKFYALLSNQLIIAARTICHDDSPEWKKTAASAFIKEVISLQLEPPKSSRWNLQISWWQFCFGSYCANLIIKDFKDKNRITFHNNHLAVAKMLLESNKKYNPAVWVWWVARKTLSDLNTYAEEFVKALSGKLRPSKETFEFWSFFPLDVPENLFNAIAENSSTRKKITNGWWYDALRKKEQSSIPTWVSGRIRQLLKNNSKDTISLYSWCDFLQKLKRRGDGDPRTGEWTVLEIARQIISLIIKSYSQFNARYIKEYKSSSRQLPCLHPANFRVPAAWKKVDSLTWDVWKNLTREKNSKVSLQPKNNRIIDTRYTPLMPDRSAFFKEVNDFMGVGLLLYGLLKCCFDLPALWNSPGHNDILSMLFKLLLNEMTCSSWTLGILQGCLAPRVTENRFIKLFQQPDAINPDTLNDPIQFNSYEELAKAIETAQDILCKHQMATLQYNARQLIPISVRQLTYSPEWKIAFGNAGEDDNV
ncbi:MAG: RNA-directed DNA polymerase [bacterium]